MFKNLLNKLSCLRKGFTIDIDEDDDNEDVVKDIMSILSNSKGYKFSVWKEESIRDMDEDEIIEKSISEVNGLENIGDYRYLVSIYEPFCRDSIDSFTMLLCHVEKSYNNTDTIMLSGADSDFLSEIVAFAMMKNGTKFMNKVVDFIKDGKYAGIESIAEIMNSMISSSLMGR